MYICISHTSVVSIVNVKQILIPNHISTFIKYFLMDHHFFQLKPEALKLHIKNESTAL
jgi:hypothetical protein